MKKTTALSTTVSEQALAELQAQFPQEHGFTRSILPRLAMVSQDKTEGKGKAMKVIAEAGTFFKEEQTDEEDADGKKVWIKEELGSAIKATVIYRRKQLKFFDESTELYTSSPVYDEDDEIVPLFCNKTEICRGTPAELKARPEYQYVKDGKTKSKLEDNRILYVLMDDTIYQLNLRGSSMYAWMTYSKSCIPPAVLTGFSSEAKEKGSICWNQMSFTTVRQLDGEEVAVIMEKMSEIREAIKQEKQYYSKVAESVKKADEDFG